MRKSGSGPAKKQRLKREKGRAVVEKFRVYKFKELPKEVREAVIQKHYDINVDHDWWDGVYSMEQENFNKVGIKFDEKQTYFSLERDWYLHSTKMWIDDTDKFADALVKDKVIPKELAKGIKEEIVSVSIDTKHYAGSSGENYIVFDVYYGDNRAEEEKLGKIADKYDEAINKWFKDKMDGFHNHLREDHDYLTSEEAIVGTIEANEYEFKKSGELYG